MLSIIELNRVGQSMSTLYIRIVVEELAAAASQSSDLSVSVGEEVLPLFALKD